jgi:hypothetical protein
MNTAQAGAPAGAPDVSVASSTTTTAPQKSASLSQRFATMMGWRSESGRTEDDQSSTETQPAEDETKAADTKAEAKPAQSDDAEAEASPSTDEKRKKESPAIPKARFDEVIKQRTEAQRERDEARLEARKATEALSLLREALMESRRAALGGSYDEDFDSQLQQAINAKAKDKLAAITSEHTAQAERAKQSAAAEAHREQLQEQYDQALATYPLASVHDVVKRMKANKSLTMSDAVRASHEDVLSRAQQHLPPPAPKPKAPQSAGHAGQGVQHRYQSNAKGMQAHFDALMRQGR